MGIRVGINGFGRIGRNFFRAQHERESDLEIVALNDLGDAKTMAHLLRYDSNLGPFPGEVELADGVLEAAGEKVKILSERDPGALPWSDLGVDVVVESTGFFTDREGAQKHLDAGAKKVVISAPATDPDLTVVLGVNDDAYDAAVAPHRLERLLHDELRRAARQGSPRARRDPERLHDDHSRVHERPGDPRLPAQGPPPGPRGRDQPHPTSTGAAKAIGLVLPDLQGKVDGISVRAPWRRARSPTSWSRSGGETSVEEVNDAFRAAADSGPLEEFLHYTEDPIVSTDINGNPYSCIFDSELTMVQGSTVKVFGWYDNEWGYSCRLVDLIGKLLP